jgi:hypothetical protein
MTRSDLKENQPRTISISCDFRLTDQLQRPCKATPARAHFVVVVFVVIVVDRIERLWL